jgi:hypothetical protein
MYGWMYKWCTWKIKIIPVQNNEWQLASPAFKSLCRIWTIISPMQTTWKKIGNGNKEISEECVREKRGSRITQTPIPAFRIHNFLKRIRETRSINQSKDPDLDWALAFPCRSQRSLAPHTAQFISTYWVERFGYPWRFLVIFKEHLPKNSLEVTRKDAGSATNISGSGSGSPKVIVPEELRNRYLPLGRLVPPLLRLLAGLLPHSAADTRHVLQQHREGRLRNPTHTVKKLVLWIRIGVH